MRNEPVAFGETHGVPWYTDPDEMLDARHPDAVSICTPHPSHPDLVAVCARHGAHVIVEKPLAPDLSGCDRAIEACERAGVKLAVISQRRLYPCVQRVRRAISDGKIGRPVLASLTVLGWRDEAYYRSDAWRGRWDTEGGGVMMNQTPHQIDLLQWLMGPVDEVYGQWDNVNHPYVEIEDTVVAVVRFRSGAHREHRPLATPSGPGSTAGSTSTARPGHPSAPRPSRAPRSSPGSQRASTLPSTTCGPFPERRISWRDGRRRIDGPRPRST